MAGDPFQLNLGIGFSSFHLIDNIQSALYYGLTGLTFWFLDCFARRLAVCVNHVLSVVSGVLLNGFPRESNAFHFCGEDIVIIFFAEVSLLSLVCIWAVRRGADVPSYS